MNRTFFIEGLAIRRDARTFLKGMTAEVLCLEAATLIKDSRRCPLWFLHARKGDEEDDRTGTDIVVTTDKGEIYIQVKSSDRYIPEHQARYPLWEGIFFIIPEHNIALETLATKLLRSLRDYYYHKHYRELIASNS